MFCHVEGVKGSQTGHKGRRVGPQKVDDPCLDGTGGEKHVTLWEGAGLGEGIKSYVTPRSPVFYSLSGPGQNPLAPDSTHHAQWVPWLKKPPNRGPGGGGGGYCIQRRSRLWAKTCPSVGTLDSCTIPRPFAPGSGTSLPLLPKVPQPSALLLHPPLPGSFLPMLSPNPSSIRPLTQKCNLSISTFQRWVSEVAISLRDPCLPPAKPKAQLRP